MNLRTYEAHRDRDAVARIWREVGWIEDDEHEKALDVFLEGGTTVVAELNGAAECVVSTNPGTLRFLEEEIPASCVTGVATSRIARRRGLATDLLAEALVRSTHEGAHVAVLGVFDQGFYDRLGFGTGAYERICTFDPSQLAVDVEARAPTRLSADDWNRIHRARQSRHRAHGAVTILSPELTHAEVLWTDGGFGLGYVDESGELTHHLWMSTKDPEEGPYRVEWMAYRSREGFLELLALIKGWADQIHTVKVHEPGDIQLQDLLRQPFRMRRITKTSKDVHQMTATAYWQIRMLDLEGCLARTQCEGADVRFNLVLVDPIEALLPASSPWRGIGGEYSIVLGRTSSATRGAKSGLPTLRASVGAFTRMWLGVRSASGLAWTDALSGSPQLLRDLDRILRLPAPSSDWDF